MSVPNVPPIGPALPADIIRGLITNADVDPAAAIAYSKLALANSITSADIVDGTITTADIADGTITGGDIASGTITSSNIVDGTITDSDLANINQFLRVRANAASNQAVARPGGQNASSSGTSGRIEYFPYLIERSVTLKELRVDVTASSTAGTLDVGLYPNTETNGIWTPGTKTETIATGLSLTTTGVRVQAWSKTLTPGVYWIGSLYLGITGGPPQTRACGGFLPFIPQQNASSSHAAGLAETGLSALPTTPAASPTNTPVVCPSLILN